MKSEKSNIDDAFDAVSVDRLLESETIRRIVGDLTEGMVEGPAEVKNILEITAELARGKTVAQGLGISTVQLEAMTAMAAQQYIAGQYQEAIKLYAFVAAMNHFDAQAFKGLAMSHKKIGRMDDAIRFFGLSLLLNPEDLESVLMTAECLTYTGKHTEARDILQKIGALQEDKNRKIDLDSLKEKASRLKKFIDAEIWKH